jgi:hypothetical protein
MTVVIGTFADQSVGVSAPLLVKRNAPRLHPMDI